MEQIEQGAAGLEVDEEVDVAVLTLVPPGNRTEDRNGAAAVPARERVNRFAVRLHEFTQRAHAPRLLTGHTLITARFDRYAERGAGRSAKQRWQQRSAASRP